MIRTLRHEDDKRKKKKTTKKKKTFPRYAKPVVLFSPQVAAWRAPMLPFLPNAVIGYSTRKIDARKSSPRKALLAGKRDFIQVLSSPRVLHHRPRWSVGRDKKRGQRSVLRTAISVRFPASSPLPMSPCAVCPSFPFLFVCRGPGSGSGYGSGVPSLVGRQKPARVFISAGVLLCFSSSGAAGHGS